MRQKLRQIAYGVQDWWDDGIVYVWAALVICFALLVLPLVYISMGVDVLRDKLRGPLVRP
jgi:hypothetical protein